MTPSMGIKTSGLGIALKYAVSETDCKTQSRDLAFLKGDGFHVCRVPDWSQRDATQPLRVVHLRELGALMRATAFLAL